MAETPLCKETGLAAGGKSEPGRLLSGYYDQAAIEAAVAAGHHREVIGGLWDEIGQLQFDFLRAQGLEPHHKVLDIGCGSLRAGVKLVRYLDAGNYFGTDLNESLLRAGYESEITKASLREKLPRTNLIADGEFDFSWSPAQFDFAIAQSVFTHLPLRYMQLCLQRLAPAMKKDARFFLTFFEIPAEHPSDQSYTHASGVVTHGARDPYHHHFADVREAATGSAWDCRYIGSWQHPRSQHIVEFVRTL